MTSPEQIRDELGALAAGLHGRRQAILATWRQAVESDPVLTTGPSLPRRQFLDHIPALLDAFEEVLRSFGLSRGHSASREEEVRAAEHGLERWRQGYQLFEVIREWRHLQVTLVREVEDLSRAFGPDAMAQARMLVTEMCADGVCESAERYFTLQRAEAQSRLEELEAGLQRYEEIERQRAENWREAAHDLRSNLGVVKTATAALNVVGLEGSDRVKSLDILHRGVESMHELLNELISLARLEAGREVRQVEPFNAAATLALLCENMRQLAESRGLVLEFEGPALLLVQGDAMKVRRIAQNLLINALTYTHEGHVLLACAEAGPDRWTLRVADSGPGFPRGAGAILLGDPPAVAPAPVADVELADASAAPNGSVATQLAMGATTSQARGGEGIGLSIVKRLCELLDATIELTTMTDVGSSFVVSFPRDYPA